jgi:hypothetical protein
MSYSWMIPPSTSRRVMAPLVPGGAAAAGSAGQDPGLVRPRLVVVVKVLGDNGFEVTSREDEQLVVIVDEEPEATACFVEVAHEVAGDLGHPRPGPVGRHTEEVNDASLHFDHEQDVVAAEHDGVDGEEVGGQQALGLGAEELGPGRAPRLGAGGTP